MNFNEHWELEGRHAVLSPSQYHWVNYPPEKLREKFISVKAKEMGTRLHALAEELISLNTKLPRNKNTLNMYVNDAIGYNMSPERKLYYSDNCFGTTDAISFRKNTLRIHDLKTGVVPASMTQLHIYAALFCLEYGYNPEKIDTVLRIYQSNEIVEETPEADEILHIMEQIIEADKIWNSMKETVQ